MYEIMFYGGLALFILGFMVSAVLFIRCDAGRIIGELIRGSKAMMPARSGHGVWEQADSGHSAKERDWRKVFRVEEDITVLAGEYFSKMPASVLRKGYVFKPEAVQKGRTDVLSNDGEITNVL